ncbi:glycoside hydrolase family 5 protein [Plenodomus tracheiphilus IPT5]|uniref:glucan 1,3-beta-glucosidase n=1 Tax=Plenodomus tracheiphilus IPT5 TaxID=1408161 RepID=A0A6A7AZR6_9PLEO|nr:glycoside hydrolase family 5 protein [Plenodomus tracheiphilus IPT5]
MPETSDNERTRDPSRRRPHGDQRRRRRESHADDSADASHRRRQSLDPERRRRRESRTERPPTTHTNTNTVYDHEGRRRKGHRATDSSGDLLPKPSPARNSREKSTSRNRAAEQTRHEIHTSADESPAPRRKRDSRRNSTTDGSGSRSRAPGAPLSLDALAKLDKTNAKKAGGWGSYDYDEEYLREVRRKEKDLEKRRVREERGRKKEERDRERERNREKERERLDEEKARKRKEEKRKAAAAATAAAGMGLGAATAAAQGKRKTDDEGKRRSAHTDDEREERRRRREAEYTPSEAEVKKERRRQEKQRRTEMKKRRVISGPLAEEGAIDDDEYQYMMEKRGGSGGPPTVYSADQLAKRKKWKKIIIGVLSVLIILAIIIPVAVMLSNKSSDNKSGTSSSAPAGVNEPKTSNLDGHDRNSVPEADRGGILDPWAWFDTEDFNVTYTNQLVGGLPIIGLNMTWDDDVQANPSVPKLSDSFKYGKTPIRGVNVGGWLNLEPFITPSFFENFGSRDGVVDEWTLLTKLGPAKAKSTLEQHYSTFITKRTFSEIRAAGIDHVRFPFGYWIVQTYDDDPYLPQVSWRYLLRGIEYCRQNGLRVNLDLHGAPGSQNGWNHSGRQGKIGWLNGPDGDKNAQRTLDIHHKLSVFFAQPRYKNLVTMYGLVNEPRNVELDTQAVVSWSEKAITQIRADGIKGIIVFGDGFMGLDNWQGKMQNIDNLLLDVHQYVIFNVDQLSLKHRDKLNFACSAWTQQSKRSMNKNTGFGPTMCGEWSQADTDCTQYINNVATGTRWEGTFDTGNASTSILSPQCPLKSSQCSCDSANADPKTYSDEYKKWLYQFGIAQMDAFEAGWGWFYWTWETEKATQWSYRRGREAGILPAKAFERDWKCPSDAADLEDFSGLAENF